MAPEHHSIIHAYEETRERFGALIGEVRALAQALGGFPIERSLDELAAALSAGPQIAVVGPYSSGKTTLINVLLGRDLLPVGGEATTSVITKIKNAPNARALLYPKSLEAMEVEVGRFEKELAKLAARSVQDQNIAEIRKLQRLITLAQARIRALQTDEQPTSEDPFENALSQAQRSGAGPLEMPLEQNELLKRALVLDEDNPIPYYLSELRVEHPCPRTVLPGSVTIVDLPGTNAPEPAHRHMIWSCLQQDPLAVLVVLPIKRTFNATDFEVFNDLKRLRSRRLTDDPLFFVVNQIDDYDEEREGRSLEDHLARIRGELELHGFEQPRLLSVSARLASIGQRALRAEPLSRREKGDLWVWTDNQPDRAYSVSQFGALLTALWQQLLPRIGNETLGQLERQLFLSIDRLGSKLQNDLEAAEQSAGDARARAAKLSAKTAAGHRVLETLPQALQTLAEAHTVALNRREQLEQALLDELQTKSKTPLEDRLRLVSKTWLEDLQALCKATAHEVEQALIDRVASELAQLDLAPSTAPHTKLMASHTALALVDISSIEALDPGSLQADAGGVFAWLSRRKQKQQHRTELETEIIPNYAKQVQASIDRALLGLIEALTNAGTARFDQHLRELEAQTETARMISDEKSGGLQAAQTRRAQASGALGQCRRSLELASASLNALLAQGEDDDWASLAAVSQAQA